MWARNILHAGEVVRACALACLGWACASAWAEGDVAPRHWAFEPLPPSAAPAPASLIDAHHASALRHAGLSASGEASRAAWLRRATFLATGLPPTTHEVEAFESDARPGAWERVVDRLLASPRHGERWAKAWLDACGYADSNGYFNADSDRPQGDRGDNQRHRAPCHAGPGAPGAARHRGTSPATARSRARAASGP